MSTEYRCRVCRRIHFGWSAPDCCGGGFIVSNDEDFGSGPIGLQRELDDEEQDEQEE